MVNESFFSELAFRDLSSHSAVFRSRLIEEFQLLDNLTESSTTAAPQYTSRDVKEPKSLQKLLLEDPYQLIKFQPFKRVQTEDWRRKDRRLTRAKNIESTPIGAIAGAIVESVFFTRLIMFLIVLTSITAGVYADLTPDQKRGSDALTAISAIDGVALIIFLLEIVLRWTDDFYGYWKDNWNIFDFIVTIGGAIPTLMELAGVSDGGNLSTTFIQIKAFRVIRTLKIVVRFGNLKMLILTILKVFESLAVIVILLMVATFIYAIIGMNLFSEFAQHDPPVSDYQWSFLTLGNTIFTLFQLLTLDRWDRMSREVMKVVDPAVAYIYFVTWVWLGAFIFRNVFVGVMVTDFHRIRDQMLERKSEFTKKKKFDKIRKKLDRELKIQAARPDKQNSPSNTPQVARSSVTDATSNDHVFEISGSLEGNIPESLVINPAELDTLEAGIAWESTVKDAMQALSGKQDSTTVWPRDTLFKYLQIMEKLQETIREHEELQSMASALLLELHDD